LAGLSMTETNVDNKTCKQEQDSLHNGNFLSLIQLLIWAK